MRNNRKSGDRPGSTRPIAGLPIVRAQVAGIDLGSERHWVCAPGLEGSGREVADFGATTPELVRMAEWLKAKGRIGGDGKHRLHRGRGGEAEQASTQDIYGPEIKREIY